MLGLFLVHLESVARTHEDSRLDPLERILVDIGIEDWGVIAITLAPATGAIQRPNAGSQPGANLGNAEALKAKSGSWVPDYLGHGVTVGLVSPEYGN